MKTSKEYDTTRKILEDIYETDIRDEKTVPHTVDEFIKEVGKEDAIEFIASFCNCAKYDGRISNDVRKWASENGLAENDAIRKRVFSDKIHRAHLNQIAEDLMTR